MRRREFLAALAAAAAPWPVLRNAEYPGMRAIRVDITGTTDANGNFSQVVRLDKTAAWQNLKVAIGTSGPAEWSLSTSNTPLTYGRGRRVTLGPELLQPFDTLTVSCTGGPVLATVQGSCTGVSGSEQEILTAYTPAPNTIALDTSTPRQKLFPDGARVPTNPLTPSYTVGPTSTVNNRFTLPVGTVAVRLLVNASGLLFTYSLFVGGHQSNEQYYGDPGAPGSPFLVPTPTLPFTIPIERDWDSQLDLSLVNPSGNTLNVYVSALFAPEQPGQAGASQAVNVVSTTLVPWDAAPDSGEPAVSVQATCTAPATGTRRWVCQMVRAELVANSTPPAVTVVRVNLRDGASGAGTILHGWTMAIQAVAGSMAPLIQLSGLSIEGSPGNAMTFEFSAGITNAFETCGFGARLL